jgi:hypothetical protein
VRRAGRILPAAEVALAAAGSAAGHGRTPAPFGYVSTVSYIDPLVFGLDARVVGGDARLRIANLSGKTVVILGYEGEPYLRFSRAGVFENVRSPAVYRNRNRWGVVAVPAEARADAEPRWRRVAAISSFSWYDHRIQWMQKGVVPPIVRASPGKPIKIFDWRVPGRADGHPFVIRGLLGYAPPPPKAAGGGGVGNWMWAGGAGLAAVAVALVGGALLLRRRRA